MSTPSIFFHIQSILTACGNIFNIFYNYSGFSRQYVTERCIRLRNLLNIYKKDYPLVSQKEVRNTNEHFDERYEEMQGNVGDYNLLDRDTDPYIRSVIQMNNHLRTFDKETGIYHTFMRKGNSLEEFEYNPHDLEYE